MPFLATMGSRLLSVVLLCAAGGGPAGFTEALDLYPHPNDPFANPLQQQAWAKPPRGLTVSEPHPLPVQT